MSPELVVPFTKHTIGEEEADITTSYEVFHGEGPVESGFVTGFHGDERKVIGVMRRALNSRVVDGTFSRSHIRVFQAHPEALRAQTRAANGVDLNRQFIMPGDMPTHPRARQLRNLVDNFPETKVLFCFHEDPEGCPFYFYDIPQHTHDFEMETFVSSLKNRLMSAIRVAGYSTYSGPDGSLGNTIEDGYIRTSAPEHYDTSFENHMVDLGAKGLNKVQRAFVFEIPSNIPMSQQEWHVDMVFSLFILPFLDKGLPMLSRAV